MYNHYIPQSDGSYRRSSVPDPPRQQQRPPQQRQERQERQEKHERQERQEQPRQKQENLPAPPPPQHAPQCQQQRPCEPACPSQPSRGLLSSLRRLLPKELDTFDLVIIALLILLSQEDNDGDLAPLLTIALYFLL